MAVIVTVMQQEEEFFVVAWSMRQGTGAPLLLVAGQKAILQAIDCSTQSLVMVRGHRNDAMDCARMLQYR